MSKPQEKRATSSSITDAWYNGAMWLYLLAPLTLIYALVCYVRMWCYRFSLFSSYRAKVPVIVVGNVTVGGTGKSPLVAYLVRELAARGYRPGVISRGYGAKIGKDECRQVLYTSSPEETGDEPLMLKQSLDCPVIVSPNRKLSVQKLESLGCNLIISDDGLQHYALKRDVEICVFDGRRGLGNGFLLPMGPMREPRSRAEAINLKVVNGNDKVSGLVNVEGLIRMDLAPAELVALEPVTEQQGARTTLALSDFSGKCVNAVAAIGNPERFFELLERNGMIVNRFAFEDHHAYSAQDFEFQDDLPLIMTEKDAVKCRVLGLKNAWYLPVEARLSENLAEMLLEKI